MEKQVEDDMEAGCIEGFLGMSFKVNMCSIAFAGHKRVALPHSDGRQPDPQSSAHKA